jgi:hypothetical protein
MVADDELQVQAPDIGRPQPTIAQSTGRNLSRIAGDQFFGRPERKRDWNDDTTGFLIATETCPIGLAPPGLRPLAREAVVVWLDPPSVLSLLLEHLFVILGAEIQIGLIIPQLCVQLQVSTECEVI